MSSFFITSRGVYVRMYLSHSSFLLHDAHFVFAYHSFPCFWHVPHYLTLKVKQYVHIFFIIPCQPWSLVFPCTRSSILYSTCSHVALSVLAVFFLHMNMSVHFLTVGNNGELPGKVLYLPSVLYLTLLDPGSLAFSNEEILSIHP